ncbi:Uncharacterised protein [Mycobacterium tuberculosis]|nr:Uncharacterised protein [Mycobacterium tuberculosis]
MTPCAMLRIESLVPVAKCSMCFLAFGARNAYSKKSLLARSSAITNRKVLSERRRKG